MLDRGIVRPMCLFDLAFADDPRAGNLPALHTSLHLAAWDQRSPVTIPMPAVVGHKRLEQKSVHAVECI
jgi:hypothetical protein